MYRRILTRDDDIVRQLFLLHTPNDARNLVIFCISWVSLLCDSPLGYIRSGGKIHRFLNQILSDPIEWIKIHSEIGAKIERGLAYKEGGIEPLVDLPLDLLNHSPIMFDFKEFVNTPFSASLLQYILTFCFFGKKLKYSANADLVQLALQDWLDIEDDLTRQILPDWVDNLAWLADLVIEKWDPLDFRPKHGNGSTAEGVVDTWQKNREFWLSTDLEEYFYLGPHYWEFTPCSKQYWYGEAIPMEKKYMKYVTLPWGASTKRGETKQIPARLTFVPKTLFSVRTIGLEPIVKQWAQQGIRPDIERGLEKVLGRHITFSDQGRNRLRAQLGSLTCPLDTIDLSAASDRLSWRLVTAIFRRLIGVLEVTRSKSIEYRGSEFLLQKFAPMGSSLCFPLQTFTYTLVVAMVYISFRYNINFMTKGSFQQMGVTLEMLNSAIKKDDFDAAYGYENFTVYGDDIVCDSKLTPAVIYALRALGFVINEEKSFMGPKTAYRESCGGFFAYGYDVTYLRYKLGSITRNMAPQKLKPMVDLANAAYELGYHNLRKTLTRFILHLPLDGVDQRDGKNPIHFGDTVDTGLTLKTRYPNNAHLEFRRAKLVGFDTKVKPTDTHILFQRDEQCSIALVQKTTPPLTKEEIAFGLNENYRWCQWHSSVAHRSMTTLAYEDSIGGKSSEDRYTPAYDHMEYRLVWSPVEYKN